MCGIAGLFRLDTVDPSLIEPMLSALAHRGPDDQSWGAHGSPPWAVMGARRLAIIDPTGGHQPAHDAGERFHVVMNGEVYNHARLRQELRGHDLVFQGGSDTEVVAQLIALAGVRTALERLRGMFALAVIDRQERRLYLARDRMGVKPLYWTQLPDGAIAFASELKALLTLPGVRRQIDEDALRAYLMFEYVPTPWSIYRGIHKLEPGTCLQVDFSGEQTWRWWRPPIPRAGGGGDPGNWARSVRGALQIAVLQRTKADVELGYLLSGGLDSSAVLAIAQARSKTPLPSFSVAVDAPGFDESSHARQVAAALGSDHHEATLRPEDLRELLPQIVATLDEPLADSSLVATWKLAALVRDAGIKAVLSGDGADESFAGYPTAQAHRLARLARPARPLLSATARLLPTTWGGVSRDYMLRQFALGLGLPWARRHQIWMGAWLPEEVGATPSTWALVDAHASAAEGSDDVGRALYLDQRLYLSDGVLTKVDRAAMAHGVEVRSPFMDHYLVELAADIPSSMKVHGKIGKWILRRAVADLLPQSVLRRPKQGFGTPVGPWLRGPCQDLLRTLPDQVEGLIAPDRVRRAIREHLAGERDHRRRLWSALILARWRVGPWGPG